MSARAPVSSQGERTEIIASLRLVDEVRLETGSDPCEVVHLPRTPSVSTPGIIEHAASPGS